MLNGKVAFGEIGFEGSRRQSTGPTNRNRIVAGARDDKVQIFKVRYLYGMCNGRYGAHERKGRCAIPREVGGVFAVS